MPQPSKAAPAGLEIDTAKALALPTPEAAAETAVETASLVKAGSAPAVLPEALVMELKATLPVIEHARVLEELRPVPQSRMARLVICIELGVEPSTSQILRAYRKASWKEITVRTPPHDESRRTFTAMSDDFRLTGSAYQGAFKDCEKDKDLTRVSFSFHERKAPDQVTPASPSTVLKAPKRPATLASPRLRMRDDVSKDAQ